MRPHTKHALTVRYCSVSSFFFSFCGRTDLPFTFGKVLLDLSADGFVDVLVQSRVSRDPVTSAGPCQAGLCKSTKAPTNQQNVTDKAKYAGDVFLLRLLPRVLQRLLTRVPLGGLLLHQVADEIFGCKPKHKKKTLLPPPRLQLFDVFAAFTGLTRV